MGKRELSYRDAIIQCLGGTVKSTGVVIEWTFSTFLYVSDQGIVARALRCHVILQAVSGDFEIEKIPIYTKPYHAQRTLSKFLGHYYFVAQIMWIFMSCKIVRISDLYNACFDDAFSCEFV